MLMATSLLYGQLTTIDNTTSRPTLGVGHDYIQSLSEIVSPANGAVSIRIAAPVPHERGLNLGVNAFVYDTNGLIQFTPDFEPNIDTFGQPNPSLGYFLNSVTLQESTFLGSGGSSVFNAPVPSTTPGIPGTLTYALPTINAQLPDVSHPIVCAYYSNFIYTDSSGGTHSMNLLYVPPSSESDCLLLNIAGNRLTGGDELYQAQFIPGSSTPPNVIVSDRHGNQLNPAIKMEDTNGNYANGANRPYNSSYSLRQTPGPPFNPGAYAINSLSVPGLGGPYTYSYPPDPSGSSGVSPNAVLVSNSGRCASTFSGQYVSGSGNTTITLPNGQSYTLSTDPSSYGLVKKITYPTGAWVSYTWGINAQSEVVTFGNAAMFGNPESSICSF